MPRGRPAGGPRPDRSCSSGCDVVALCRDLIADFDTGTFVPAVVRLIAGHVSIDAGVLYLYDDARDQLVPVSSTGCDPEAIGPMRLGRDESAVAGVFESGRARLYKGPAVGPRSPAAAHCLCLPLTANGATFGCLILEKRDEVFARRDLAFLDDAMDLVAHFVRRAETMRLRQEKRISEFVTTLSHELRTPLTCIKGYATALLQDDVQLDGALRAEFLETIDAESDVMNDLIEDLMKSSLVETGFLRIRKQPILMGRLIRKAVDDFKAKTRRHRIEVRPSPGFPVLEADPDRIGQVLDNILDNAIKYSPDGGLVVIQGKLGEGEAVVSVADQGIGIAPEDLNRLFEKFYRVKSELAGTGLGLPVAREIIEKHGGRIWATSAPGQGSTFYFTLPLTEISGLPVDAARRWVAD